MPLETKANPNTAKMNTRAPPKCQSQRTMTTRTASTRAHNDERGGATSNQRSLGSRALRVPTRRRRARGDKGMKGYEMKRSGEEEDEELQRKNGDETTLHCKTRFEPLS